MLSQESTNREPAALSLDVVVERFEEAWNQCNGILPDLTRFLPSEKTADFQEAAVELIRIDMERRIASGQPQRLNAYLDRFPWISSAPRWLGELAFEEYRLRLSEGEEVESKEYSDTYEIDTSRWPVPRQSHVKTDAIRQWNESTFNILKDESERIVRSVAGMPSVGDRFGDFQIVEKLGEGKFARVYLAQQGELADRQVALKISADLWSESDKLARLQHTNIVPIYSIHRIDDLLAICMPYLGRQTLAGELKKRASHLDRTTQLDRADRESEQAWARFAAKLADALAHAHARNIVHRDLKPANILLSDESPDGEFEPLVLDFNLSENLVVGGAMSLMVGGTIPYMAPEHLQAVVSRTRLEPTCDIYSLGVILYQIMTGELPFPNRDGNFVDSIMQMVKDRKTDKRWRDRLAHVASPDMMSIISKCLEPDTEKRYQTAGELRVDLYRHANQQSLEHARNHSVRQALSKWCRRHRHRLSLGTLTMVGLLSLAIASTFAAWQWKQISRLNAVRQAEIFDAEFDSLQLSLLSTAAPKLQETATSTVLTWVNKYGVLDDATWRQRAPYRYLDEDHQAGMQAKLGELLYLLSQARGRFVDMGDPSQQEKLYVAAGACLLPAFNLPAPQAEWDVTQLPSESTVGKRLAIVELLNAGKFGEAAEACDQALQDNPADNSIWLCQGICEQAAGRADSAELAYTRCIALSPKDPLGYLHRGAIRLDVGRASAATEDFDRALELEPKLDSAMLNRALALHGAGLHAAAWQQIEAIPESSELLYRILMVRASIAQALDDKEAVEQLNAELLASAPADAVGWVHRGRLNVALDAAAAISDFETALRLVPNYRAALQNLAAMYAEVLKQPQPAHELLEAWIAAYPQDPVPHASRAVLFARDGKVEQSLQEIEESERLGKTTESLYYLASAFSLASQQQPELADRGVEAMRLCLNKDHDSAWFDRAIRDPDLIPLRSNPKFGKLFSAAKLMNQGWP